MTRFRRFAEVRVAAALLALSAACMVTEAVAAAAAPDAGPIREVTYDTGSIIRVPVKRGVATHVELEPGETIRFAAAGVGSDCARVEHTWCIVASEGTGHVFAKPREHAGSSNTLAVVTDRRSYSFVFDVAAGAREPALRVIVRTPRPMRLAGAGDAAAALLASGPQPREIVDRRLAVPPQVVNAKYSVAVGQASSDIVPTLVFDDGRFTYLQFPNNREVPAAFQVNADRSESLVNVRMERDYLVADRVSRRLVLRLGQAVVSVINEAYDADGNAPVGGTTTPGVQRIVRDPATGEFGRGP